MRLIGDGAALMHAKGSTIMRGQSAPAPSRHSIQTLVAVRRDGRWLLTAFQNTRVRPIGRTWASTMALLVGDWLWTLARPR